MGDEFMEDIDALIAEVQRENPWGYSYNDLIQMCRRLLIALIATRAHVTELKAAQKTPAKVTVKAAKATISHA